MRSFVAGRVSKSYHKYPAMHAMMGCCFGRVFTVVHTNWEVTDVNNIPIGRSADVSHYSQLSIKLSGLGWSFQNSYTIVMCFVHQWQCAKICITHFPQAQQHPGNCVGSIVRIPCRMQGHGCSTLKLDGHGQHKCTHTNIFMCMPQTSAYDLWCNLHKAVKYACRNMQASQGDKM